MITTAPAPIATALPRLALLVSGRGSNLQAVLDAITAGQLNALVVGVFSDRPTAPALQRVAADVRWSARPNAFASRPDYDAALADAVAACHPDWVVCAGYMRLLPAAFLARFSHRVLNIHPSLLPRHRGLETHARVLAAGEREHGCSVHFVIPQLDAGAVIAQATIPVHPADTPQTLATRLLPVEHQLLLAVLQWATQGRLHEHDGHACLDGHALFTPRQLVLPAAGNATTSRADPRTRPGTQDPS